MSNSEPHAAAFPLLGKSFKGRKGDALATRGVKWLFSQWIRVRSTQ